MQSHNGTPPVTAKRITRGQTITGIVLLTVALILITRITIRLPGRHVRNSAASPPAVSRIDDNNRVRSAVPERVEDRNTVAAWAGPHRQNTMFNDGMFRQMLSAAEIEKNTVTAVPKGRDPFYDRLLLMQGRDYAREELMRSRLMTALGDSPDTLVGDVMCSSQFCRLELRGVGKIDVREHWQPAITAAVAPRGLKFFVIAHDEDGNTFTNYYFGLDKTWTVPDFYALGMLPARHGERHPLP